MRHASTVGAVTFFVLAVVIAALWNRSTRIADSVGRLTSAEADLNHGLRATERELGAVSVNGQVCLVWQVSWFTPLDQLRCPECGT